jgi:hypothetical protein
MARTGGRSDAWRKPCGKNCYLVAVAAVCDGQCAVLDDATCELLPFDLRTG